MLNGTLELHNIRDVEGFTDRIINRRRLHWLQAHEREDLHVYLIETCWELSFKHRPEGTKFSRWASRALNLRITDWIRKEFGRTKWLDGNRWENGVYERAVTEIVSLNDDRLADVDTRVAVDFTEDRSIDLVRVLGSGDRGAPGGNGAMGEAPTVPAERRVA